MLNKDHAESDERTLTDEVDRVFSHRLEDINCVLQAGPSTGNTKCEGCTTSDMWVVALTEQLHNAGYMRWILEQQESK